MKADFHLQLRWLNFDGLECVFLPFSEKKKPTPDCGYIQVCVHMYILTTVLSLTNHRLEITKPISGLVFTKSLEYLNKKL